MARIERPLLLPPPRRFSRLPGTFDARRGTRIHLESKQAADLWFIGLQLQGWLLEATQEGWLIRAGIETPDISLATDPTLSSGPEAYRLHITPERVELTGGGAAGVFYGCQTLRQLLRQYGPNLPCLHIEDGPDFPTRGYLLDTSRDRVPTMETLFALVDRLAEWKINHLQLYTEHTFAYAGHEVVWRNASPMTGEEIMQLDAYCRERFLDLVPNQASFGHMDRWLKHPAYRHLAESPNGWEFHGHHVPYPFTLNPLLPESLELVKGLYRDLLPHFTSRLFNVNADEAFDLGQGSSRKEVTQRGKPAVYFEFLNKLNDLAQDAGRRMLYWADFYWQHPQTVKMHPKGAVALEWGYEADHDFDSHTSCLAAADIAFYVCPGTSAWNSFLGRTDNAIANIANAAESGLRNGAIGLLNTDWGDNGSLAYLPVSYPGIAYGAACAWCLEKAREMPLADSLSLHAFGDPTGETGRIAFDLGNAYRLSDPHLRNSAAPFWLMIRDMFIGWRPLGLDVKQLQQSLDYITTVSARWRQAQPTGPDAALVRDEFANNTAMWQHACRCGLALAQETTNSYRGWRALAEDLQAIVTEHHRLWLARHRPGGLADSAARLGSRLTDYLTSAMRMGH